MMKLFGIEALNHAAWSRFALEVNADWLRDHLLSSREGVRDSEAIPAIPRLPSTDIQLVSISLRGVVP